MSQPIREKRIRVGDDVETYCGRCKAERTHVVASMSTAAEPAEVICRTCNNQHRFRRPADAARPRREPRAGSAETGARRAPKPARETPPVSARPYSPSESYAEGEWIEHRTHGVGRVKAVRGGKIDVSFDKDLRTLLHAG
jgi:hypothetical protein